MAGGVSDAYMVGRAVDRISRLAARIAAESVCTRLQTSRGLRPRQTASSNRKVVDEIRLSSMPPISLHPTGPFLDRTELISQIQQVAPDTLVSYHVLTADLSHIVDGRDPLPLPPIKLRNEEEPGVDDVIQPELKPSSMPSHRLSRLFHYRSLAVGLGMGALGEATRRWSGNETPNTTSPPSSSVFLSPANIERIVDKLSKMRGAALKLGQMLSIQDTKSMSPEIAEVLQRVQNAANYVPIAQVQRIMKKDLGKDQWQSNFVSFNDTPFAAASIGQVHKAQLSPRLSESYGFDKVAVKVQYPGIASSIDSDLDNMQSLLVMSKLLPRGMYLENTIRVARKELHWECDYRREAEAMSKFGLLLKDDPVFVVPRLIDELSTDMLLTAEYMEGMHIKQVADMAGPNSQQIKNYIGTSIMRLCLQELFEFEFMQTDPNWANFLYNPETSNIALLDFGAARSFGKEFLDKYLLTLKAAMDGDREGCRHWSTELGFLTGYEAEIMTNAHVDSMLEIGKPFRQPGVYDFGNQDVSDNVRSAIPIMLRHRLTPPPEETYSLHRKLSGAFLLCIRLGAQVPCQDLFKSITAKYTFSDGAKIEY